MPGCSVQLGVGVELLGPSHEHRVKWVKMQDGFQLPATIGNRIDPRLNVGVEVAGIEEHVLAAGQPHQRCVGSNVQWPDFE